MSYKIFQSDLFIISNFSDISSVKHFKISELFWIFDMEEFGKDIF